MRLTLHRASLAAIALAAAALACAGAAPAAAPPADPTRVVAIGDIHCEYDGLVGILREAGLIDRELRWSGGKTLLVQTGDVLDRGAGCRQVLHLLRELERQAAKSGGGMRVLIGNHEGFNLAHEFRDVSPEAFASFADAKSEKRRERAFRDWVAFRQRRGATAGDAPAAPADAERQQWMDAHPPGWLEYQEAVGPRGEHGRWLRRLPAVAQVGDTLFMHGGIPPALQELTVEQINERLRQEVAALDESRALLVERGLILPFFSFGELLEAATEARAALPPASSTESAADTALRAALARLEGVGAWFLFHADSPLWFRGYARWSEEEGAPLATALAQAYGVEHLVVGHSPPPAGPGRIEARFGGRIFLIDTGMLPGHYPGGRASALEIAGGRFTAIYAGARAVLLEPAARAAARAAQRPARTAFVHASFLAAAQATPPAPAPQAVPPVLSERRVWMARDGSPLPLSSDAEAEAFLRDAKVVKQESIPVGVTHPLRLVLEKDGVEARAIFRYLDRDVSNVRLPNGTLVLHLRDSYRFEVAAYELARLLGLTNLAPAVERRVASRRGSVQLWIEKAMTEQERLADKIEPPNPGQWSRQVYDMFVFDNLIGNLDRNQGNFLADANWRLWMVDHTRTFSRDDRLPNPERLSHCSRALWDAVRALEPEAVKARLSRYVGRYEIEALFKRRAKLVELLQKRIAERGAARVIFDYSGPPPEAPPALPAPPDEGGRAPKTRSSS